MSGSDYYRDMAVQWRELAEIGDPARRAERQRWAAALERMAQTEAAGQGIVAKENKS